MNIQNEPAIAADIILTSNEFGTNVQCLNALFGVTGTCEIWSDYFGGYIGYGDDALPVDVAAAVEATRSIVEAQRN